MKEIKIGKVTVSIGVGEAGERLEKAKILLERITGQTAAITRARKREQVFGIKKGQPIGVKVTLRGPKAVEWLKKALDAVDFKVKERSFGPGTFAFGIREYIDFPGLRYDPAIGIFGLDVNVTLVRPGFRVALRRRRPSKIGKAHRISKEETIEWAKNLGAIIVQ